MNDLKFTTCGDYVNDQQTIQRIGFACKYMHPDQTQKKKILEEIQRPLNTRSTTVQWLNRQTTRSCRATTVGYYGTQYTSVL